ncbi:MAG: hypothetical protein BWZ10_01277 [candidate division BRC1 bacterium ADurb.BinA364]|nr:MAG: hypothetical protein BWZ10_01277 [candidate division BRC1 bacterium ADurb.BinA364]
MGGLSGAKSQFRIAPLNLGRIQNRGGEPRQRLGIGSGRRKDALAQGASRLPVRLRLLHRPKIRPQQCRRRRRSVAQRGARIVQPRQPFERRRESRPLRRPPPFDRARRPRQKRIRQRFRRNPQRRQPALLGRAVGIGGDSERNRERQLGEKSARERRVRTAGHSRERHGGPIIFTCGGGAGLFEPLQRWNASGIPRRPKNNGARRAPIAQRPVRFRAPEPFDARQRRLRRFGRARAASAEQEKCRCQSRGKYRQAPGLRGYAIEQECSLHRRPIPFAKTHSHGGPRGRQPRARSIPT